MGARSLRRRAADARARWFARRVARLSDERLARIMRGPQRALWLSQVFRAMPSQLDTEEARNVEAVVDYRIGGRRDGGEDRWRAVVSPAGCRTMRTGDGAPDVSLALDAASFIRLVSGNATGPQLFLLGRLEVDGDLALAMRLPTLFRIPRPGARED